MPFVRKLQSILRPKNIWMCIKGLIKFYVAFYVVQDLIIHIIRIPNYSKPFASALVSYTNNYAEHSKLSRSLSPNDENAKIARKHVAAIQAYKKLLPLVEEDKILAKENNFAVENEFDEFGNQVDGLIRLSNQSKKQKRMLLRIDHNCPEGQELEECLDETEKTGQVVLDNMERLDGMIRTKLIELEAKEPQLRLDLELQGGIFAQHCLSILECLYILYLLFRSGAKKYHLVFLFSTLAFHYLFIFWMAWRKFLRWTKDNSEFNLAYEIGM